METAVSTLPKSGIGVLLPGSIDAQSPAAAVQPGANPGTHAVQPITPAGTHAVQPGTHAGTHAGAPLNSLTTATVKALSSAPVHLDSRAPALSPDGFSNPCLAAEPFIGQVRDIVASMLSIPNLTERLQYLVEALVLRYHFRSAAVFSLTEQGARPTLTASFEITPGEQATAAAWLTAEVRKLGRNTGSHTGISTEPRLLGDDGIILPVGVPGRLTGAIALFDKEASGRLSKERDFLSLISIAAILLVEHAQSQTQAQTNRAAWQEQIQTIAETGQMISGRLDVNEVCSNILSVLRRLVSARAGYIMLHQPQDDTLVVVTYQGVGRERLAHAKLSTSDGVSGRAFRFVKPAFITDVQKSDTFIFRDAAVKSGLRALVVVPLLVRSETIGVLGLFLGEAPRSEAEQTELIETIEIFGSQAASAIQNARLYCQLEQAYQRERRIAETFQQALLADIPSDIPGIEIGHTYQAALDEAVVGGDFYDVFTLADGRIALAIGDVSGKGLAAAVQTARVKFGMRAVACPGCSPARVVEQTHHSLIQQGAHDGFVSLFFGIFNPLTGQLRYTNAGHEPPILLRAHASVEWLGRTATVIGLNLPVKLDFEEAEVQLEPGDQMLLYTDGLTEARRNGKFLTRPGLLDLWQRCATAPPRESAVRLLESVRRYAHNQLRDDAALIVVKLGEKDSL